MTQPLDHANALKALHIKGNPLVLFNVWDAGSAKELIKAGGKAVATSSWAIAAAHGYADGEELPFDLALATLKTIVRVASAPVTIDIEAGYNNIEETVKKVADAGASGINIEDQVIGKNTLYSCEEQCTRLAAARGATPVPIFINARTDVFFKSAPETHTEDHLQEALFRASAYKNAGADGLFTPGLANEKLIAALCERSPLPINIMMGANSPSPKRLAELGVSRISYGPIPYLRAMDAFQTAAHQALENKE